VCPIGRDARSGEKEPIMTLKPGPTARARTVGHISHIAQARVDQRVREILARRVALDRARRAARASTERREQR
jgi:hypothetical protein